MPLHLCTQFTDVGHMVAEVSKVYGYRCVAVDRLLTQANEALPMQKLV